MNRMFRVASTSVPRPPGHRCNQRRKILAITTAAGVIAVGAGCSDQLPPVGPGQPTGVSVERAGCGEILTEVIPAVSATATPAATASPPSFGDDTEPGLLDTAGAGPFFTVQDAPRLPLVLGALKQGALVLWYDPSAPQTTVDAARNMALSLKNEPSRPFIAVPWTAQQGTFPNSAKVVLTKWTGDRAFRQTCVDVSESVVMAFRATTQ